MKLPFKDAKQSAMGAIESTKSYIELIAVMKAEIEWLKTNKENFHSR
jgi:hypothetical protein